MSTTSIVLFGALTALVALLGIVVVGTLKRVVPLVEDARNLLADASFRAHVLGLPAGAVIPAFMAERAGGGMYSDADLRGHESVVLFLDSGCSFCETLFRDLASGSTPDFGRRLVIVTSLDGDAQRLAQIESEAIIVLLQRSRAIARLFETARTPHAFVIDANLRVLGSGAPTDWDEMKQIIGAVGSGTRSEGGALEQHTLTAAV